MKTFWKFTRPHTIIGSFISVTALYLLSVRSFEFSVTFYFALLAALFCNIFITGYNQLVDIELDKVNKPYLPLASGEMSVKTGRIIVFSSLILSIVISILTSFELFGLIGVISFLGFIYSWKRIYLKRYHQLAATAIILVRGILVNLGFYAFFSDSLEFPPEIWTLTFFVVLFSAGIAWFKDIPDMEGDAADNIGSLAVLKGAKKTFAAGVWLIGSAYTLAAFAPLLFEFELAKSGLIIFGHGLLGGTFLGFASRTNPSNKQAMKRFYMSFWVLFFLEYLLWVASFFI